jgi:hypothetical protein
MPESSAERELLRVMILHPDLVEQVVEQVARVDADDGVQPDADMEMVAGPAQVVRDPVYAAIFHELAAGGDLSIEALAERLGPFENHVVEQLRSEPGAVVDPHRSVADAIRMLKARALRERIDEHARMLPLADESEKNGLLRRAEALRKELAAVGGREWRSVRRQGA